MTITVEGPHPVNFRMNKHVISGQDGETVEWMSLFKLFLFQTNINNTLMYHILLNDTLIYHSLI